MSAGKPAANAVWIIGGKILLALLHLGVSMTAARRLGPGGFGEIQYAAAVTGLLLPLCTLGLHDVLIPELVLHPQNSGVAPGLRSGDAAGRLPWEFWSCGGSFCSGRDKEKAVPLPFSTA